MGEGSENQPYMEIPDFESLTVTTVSIPAGKSLFYGIYRVGGMYFTIKDSDACVVYNGTTYEAENGKLSFKVDSALASDAVIFEIVNNGDSDKAFTISFSNPKGTYSNPETVSSVEEETVVHLEAGSDVGYYYKYVAEKDGTIRFYMTATVDSIILVTNNRNSAQRTSESDVLTDENGVEYVALDVLEGDEIIINVGAKPNKRGKYPETEITWYGEYN